MITKKHIEEMKKARNDMFNAIVYFDSAKTKFKCFGQNYKHYHGTMGDFEEIEDTLFDIFASIDDHLIEISTIENLNKK